MQLSLNIEFETITLPEKHKPSILKCVFCAEKKDCYEFLPMRDSWSGIIDIYEGAHHCVCEECFNKKNVDGYLDELLYHERRIEEVRSLKYTLKQHNRNIKTAITHQLIDHNVSNRISRNIFTRKVLFEKTIPTIIVRLKTSI